MKKSYALHLQKFAFALLVGFGSLGLSAQDLAPLPPLNSEMSIEGRNDHHSYHVDEQNPCKVFIGVQSSSVPEGVLVDHVIENTPATQAGIEKGDIILRIDNVPVKTQPELIQQRNTHQPGDAFTLTILRQGREQVVNCRFKNCTEADKEAAAKAREYKMDKKRFDFAFESKGCNTNVTERPIIGIYENEDINVNGVAIGSVIEGKGAALAGLREGDVVVAVDGKKVTGIHTLRTAIGTHKAGETVRVNYQRNGSDLETMLTLSADRTFINHSVERDPCAVFIGIYSSNEGNGTRGSRITGIIDGTPAKESGLQPGDVVLAMDGVEINSHTELLAQRNKHKPGDPFTLLIQREGAQITVNSTFKSCDKNKQATTKEKVEVIQETKPVLQDNKVVEGIPALNIENLSLFPNPTVGPLSIQFEAAAVPTKITITDLTGRTIFNRDLPRFDGYFSEQTEIGNAPGTYILTIEQEGKVLSKKIVLMPKA